MFKKKSVMDVRNRSHINSNLYKPKPRGNSCVAVRAEKAVSSKLG